MGCTWLQPAKTTIDEFPYVVDLPRTELVVSARDPAVRGAVKLFKRFGWDRSAEAVRGWQVGVGAQIRRTLAVSRSAATAPGDRTLAFVWPSPNCYHRNRQETPLMQNVSIQKASELSPAVRSAVEQLLGRSIAPDEEISVAAVPRQRVPATESRAAVARNLEEFLNRRAVKVNGLPEEEIDAAIDEALHAVRRPRA
jgi:hypothetical protein